MAKMKNKHAIIVAVENYHESLNLAKVQFALNDANGMVSALQKLGYDKDNIEIVTNDYATKTTILERIKKILNYAQDGESILFYFAGHGFFTTGRI